MKKVILNLDSGNQVTDNDGGLVGHLIGSYDEVVDTSTADTTLQLVKQGVTVDEIIKLKNADLL